MPKVGTVPKIKPWENQHFIGLFNDRSLLKQAVLHDNTATGRLPTKTVHSFFNRLIFFKVFLVFSF